MKFTASEIENISNNSAEIVFGELQENFHKRKCNSLLLADSYGRIIDKYMENEDLKILDKMAKKAKRVRGCGAYLEYRLDPNRLNEQSYQRLNKANFCSDALCPICQWRKARKLVNQLQATMMKLNGYKFIFLTLTIKGVKSDELCTALDNMLGVAWHNLINNRRFKNSIKGFFRSVEIAHDAEPLITKSDYKRKKNYYRRKGLSIGAINPSYDLYKPHIHVLLAVRPYYFSKYCNYYIPQREWREMWKNALGVDYDPYVYIENIYKKESEKKDDKHETSEMSAMLEAAKYTAKSQEYLIRDADNKIIHDRTDEAVYTISTSLARRRLISWGGCFREAHKALHLDSVEDGDLLHIETEAQNALTEYIAFKCVWRGKSGYSIKSTYNEL